MEDDETSSAAFRIVEDWLRSMGLICYAQAFYDNGYENIDICKEIGEEDLNVLSVTNIKDRNDILAGVCRIKQKAVYFELEPDEDLPSEPIIRKLDPFLLITRVKAELEKENVQLTEPPYFYPVSNYIWNIIIYVKSPFRYQMSLENIMNFRGICFASNFAQIFCQQISWKEVKQNDLQ